MLVDHANPVVDGISRGAQIDKRTINPDRTFIGSIQSCEDIHKGTLTCAVFAQQGMDLTRPQGKINPVIRYDTGKSLGNSS